MRTIYILTDYRGYFLSKNHASPPGSGMSHDLLIKYFNEGGYKVVFLTINKAANSLETLKNELVLYTSSEDPCGYYKSFIEDVICALEISGAKVLPSYLFLKAHNNKTFQELFRQIYLREVPPKAFVFGTKEDFESTEQYNLKYPIVFKLFDGAMSKNVALGNNKKELFKIIKKRTDVDNIKVKVRNKLRRIIHKGFLTITPFRKKFVLQNFIPELSNDWKVLVFGSRYYIFERPVRKNDFRASGSGHDIYKYGSHVEAPEGIFDFALNVKKLLNTPIVSLDICRDVNMYCLLEYQAVHFGTVGQVKADSYYTKEGNEWIITYEKLDLEKVYVDAVCQYLK